jgi:hypothetical protein
MPKAKKTSTKKSTVKAKKVVSKPVKTVSKATKIHLSRKLILLSLAVLLAVAAYFTYQSMLTSPDINKIAPGDPIRRPKPTSKPPTNNVAPNKPQTKCSPGYKLQGGKCIRTQQYPAPTP